MISLEDSNHTHVPCDVCGAPIETTYCTLNVCRACCESGKCPCDKTCAAKHPERLLI